MPVPDHGNSGRENSGVDRVCCCGRHSVVPQWKGMEGMKSFRMTRYAGQIARLVARKKEQVLEKQRKLGKADEDDYGYVLPPEDFMKNFHFPEVNENGSFYGVRA